MSRVLIPLILLIIFSGCEPYRYVLNYKKEYRIYGHNLGEIDKVIKIGDNAIAIDSNTVTSLGTPGLTNFLADFSIKLHSGEGIRFYFRTVEHKFETNNKLSFDYTTGGSSVRKNNIIIDNLEEVKANIGREDRIRILNDASTFMIMVNCDTVYTGRTQLPATEYIILETHHQTRATVFGINFEEVYNHKLPYFEDKIF